VRHHIVGRPSKSRNTSSAAAAEILTSAAAFPVSPVDSPSSCPVTIEIGALCRRTSASPDLDHRKPRHVQMLPCHFAIILDWVPTTKRSCRTAEACPENSVGRLFDAARTTSPHSSVFRRIQLRGPQNLPPPKFYRVPAHPAAARSSHRPGPNESGWKYRVIFQFNPLQAPLAVDKRAMAPGKMSRDLRGRRPLPE